MKDSELGPCGGVILAHCLKSNSSVTVVEAFGCAFGAEGGKAMAEALEANKTLEEISVGNLIVGCTVKLKSSGEMKTVSKCNWRDGKISVEGQPQEFESALKPSEFEWESQVPAVLQTLFDQASGEQPAAMQSQALANQTAMATQNRYGDVLGSMQIDAQKAAEIALGPAQRRAMHIVHGQQRLKNVKIPHVPTIYRVKSGNAAALSL